MNYYYKFAARFLAYISVILPFVYFVNVLNLNTSWIDQENLVGSWIIWWLVFVSSPELPLLFILATTIILLGFGLERNEKKGVDFYVTLLFLVPYIFIMLSRKEYFDTESATYYTTMTGSTWPLTYIAILSFVYIIGMLFHFFTKKYYQSLRPY